MPVTTPAPETVATAEFVLLQTPPPVPLAEKDVFVPTQIAAVPVIVPGTAVGLTETDFVAANVPQPLETV
jgi:hypothetical protein